MHRILSAVALLFPVAAMAAQVVDNPEFMFIKHLPGFVPSGYVDASGPQVVSFSPSSGATGVATGAVLSFTFDENVQKGAGEIVITAGGAEFERVAVASGNVSVSGKDATINPVADFARGETYTVSVPAGAFVDVRGNASGAVSGWSFTTVENGAPNFTSSAITSVMEGTPYSYFATAEDAEGDALSFSFADKQPGWLNLDDHGDGTATLWGTPQEGDVGDQPITLVVSDGSRTASQEFTIAVVANGTPVFTSAAITEGREGVLYSYVAIVDDSLSDTLDITAETLPAWLGFTPDNENRTALVEGTPAAAEVGSHDVVLRVSDGLKSSTQEFTITVAANDAPVWASPAEGSLGTVLVDEAITPVTFVADDTDAPVIYGADPETLPPGLALSGDTLSGTPTVAGSYDFTVTATDSLGATASRAFSMTVVDDATPDAFSFAAVTGAALSTLQTSDAVIITGITGNADISITGGSYRIDSGSYTTAAGTIAAGQTVTLQQTSSASLNTTTTATLTVGTVSADWTVTTLASCTDSPGTVCADGSVYAGTTPDGNVPLYVTRCDAGMSWDGSACTGTRSAIAWNNGTLNFATTGITSAATGKANTATLSELVSTDSPYQAAKYCQDLVLHGQNDWYLPASNEISVIHANSVAIGGFNFSGTWTPGYYWSSSESEDYSGRALSGRFSDGSQRADDKYTGISVRCARGGAGNDNTLAAFTFAAPATPVNYGVTVTLTGTVEPGATVTISGAATGNATVVGSNWNFTTSALTTMGVNTFTATATDAAGNTDSASQSVTVSSINIVAFGGGRRWADGTYADGCNSYLNPPANYAYSGSTGDGAYTVDPDGAGSGAPLDIFCDMTTDGGGWMLVMNNINNSMSLDLAGSTVSALPNLTAGGNVNFYAWLNGSRNLRWTAGNGGPTGIGTTILWAQENGTKISMPFSGGGGTACQSTSLRYVWTKVYTDAGWSNTHSTGITTCSGWTDVGSVIVNYFASADCGNCYTPVSVFFGNGYSGYYAHGNTYDYDYMDWGGRAVFVDTAPGFWSSSLTQRIWFR